MTNFLDSQLEVPTKGASARPRRSGFAAILAAGLLLAGCSTPQLNLKGACDELGPIMKDFGQVTPTADRYAEYAPKVRALMERADTDTKPVLETLVKAMDAGASGDTSAMWKLAGASIALVAGCAAAGSTSYTVDTPSPTPTEETAAEAVEEAEETTSVSEYTWGQSAAVEDADGNEVYITIGKPSKAKCQYSAIGCDKPEIGDRVVTVPVTIQNAGGSATEWGRDYFAVEFADGTQVQMGDGSASDYTPDNALDYEVKVRAGGKLKSTLVFEAPKGAFSVLMLTSQFGGEPLAMWD